MKFSDSNDASAFIDSPFKGSGIIVVKGTKRV